jgi:hypothetical protein
MIRQRQKGKSSTSPQGSLAVEDFSGEKIEGDDSKNRSSKGDKTGSCYPVWDDIMC